MFPVLLYPHQFSHIPMNFVLYGFVFHSFALYLLFLFSLFHVFLYSFRQVPSVLCFSILQTVPVFSSFFLPSRSILLQLPSGVLPPPIQFLLEFPENIPDSGKWEFPTGTEPPLHTRLQAATSCPFSPFFPPEKIAVAPPFLPRTLPYLWFLYRSLQFSLYCSQIDKAIP